MNIELKIINEDTFSVNVTMLTNLMNYHRKLTNAPKEFWQTDEESSKTLREWMSIGRVYNIYSDGKIAGFFYVRLGGQKVAWLEDLYIEDEFRNRGLGKASMKFLDEILQEEGTLAMFVDVIPRNSSAIKFYKECGFDYLNMIQLRKNYDDRFNKDEEIELLGFKFKKY